MVYCPVMIRKRYFADYGNHMNLPNSAYTLSFNQRKIIAVFTLVLTLTNSRVSLTQAAEPLVEVIQPALVQSIATDQADEVDATTTATTTAPTVQEVLLNVCEENGYGQPCAQTLLGMLMNESSNISTAIGDRGKARGYFQIHYKLHKITTDCAEDLVCSADWTIHYMEAHSYPKYTAYAIQCHNSCNVENGYAAKAIRNGKRYWKQPMKVTQAKPVVLAVNTIK